VSTDRRRGCTLLESLLYSRKRAFLFPLRGGETKGGVQEGFRPSSLSLPLSFEGEGDKGGEVEKMYKEHPAFEKPSDENAKIWRYMNFTEYASLLDKSSLFFARADKLGDPFEGSYTKVNIERRSAIHKKRLDSLPTQLQPFRDVFERGQKDYSEFLKMLRKHVYISCWHKNDYESAAMWRLYLKSNEGVAIQSTFNRFRQCFKEEMPDIYIGIVQYIDYKNDIISEQNLFYPFLCKRKSFEHEQELRAVIFHPNFTKTPEGPLDFSKPAFEDGKNVSADLDLLINKIHLAPTSPEWLLELLKSITRKYGLDENRVHQSDLDNEPFF
jgi:hypothetical protein